VIKLSQENLISPEEVNELYSYLPRIIYEVATRWDLDNTQKGHMFEDEIIKRLQSIGYDPWKAPGRRITVKGLSNVDHENDIIFVKRFSTDPVYLVEVKWRDSDLITKEHIMIFNQKALDIYFRGYIDGLRINKMYRIFIASQPLTLAAFKICLTNGILVLMPFRPDLSDRSKREGGPVILPPLEWAIASIEERIKDKRVDQDKIYLLDRLKKLRGKIFRECSCFPDPNIHKGDLLLDEYRMLIWEVDPEKIQL